MSQIDTILKLCTDSNQVFCQIVRPILLSPDVRELLFQPQRTTAQNVLSNLRIHQRTTLRAGANSIGIPETIEKLEKKRPNEEILSFTFEVESKQLGGNCYTDINATELIGCYFIEIRPMKPDAIISVCFKTPEENGRNTAVQGDYYNCPLFIDGEGFDCRLLLGRNKLELGVRYEVPIKFLFPELVRTKLTVGKEVTLWEGKEIASGTVLKIYN
jgi:hypothetical protein